MRNLGCDLKHIITFRGKNLLFSMGLSYSTPPKRISKYYPAFENTLPSMSGKVVLITGCTSGTGYDKREKFESALRINAHWFYFWSIGLKPLILCADSSLHELWPRKGQKSSCSIAGNSRLSPLINSFFHAMVAFDVMISSSGKIWTCRCCGKKTQRRVSQCKDLIRRLRSHEPRLGTQSCRKHQAKVWRRHRRPLQQRRHHGGRGQAN